MLLVNYVFISDRLISVVVFLRKELVCILVSGLAQLSGVDCPWLLLTLPELFISNVWTPHVTCCSFPHIFICHDVSLK